MRDSVVEAHRSIEDLLDRTRSALEQRSERAAREGFVRVREALEAHFDQEDRLYYPAIAALRAETRNVVETICSAHEAFREQFQRIAECLEAGDLAEAALAFAVFVDGFSKHETVEERLLERLDREVAAER